MLVIWYLMRRPLLTRSTKIILLFGIGLLPLGAAMSGNYAGFEATKQRSFCGSCHVMTEYANDSGNPNSETLAARHGRIVVVTSFVAREPEEAMIFSNALRPAVHGVINSLSREVAHAGVTVNAVMPGFVATQRLLDLGADPVKVHARIPMGRYGDPAEVEKAKLTLRSAAIGYGLALLAPLFVTIVGKWVAR